MRPLVLALTCTLALSLGGCDTVTETLQDTRETVSEGLQRLQWCTAAFRLGAAVERQDLEAGRSAAEDLRTNAPDELEGDLDVILAAIDEAEAGDPEALQDPAVRDAGQRVLAAAETQCDPTTRPE